MVPILFCIIWFFLFLLKLRYHVPRSFLSNDDNTLVLLEELGGNPYNVKFQTVTIGKACANAYEGHRLDLACQGQNVISEIKFASFGGPKGECGSFEKGQCESSRALKIIKHVMYHHSCFFSILYMILYCICSLN